MLPAHNEERYLGAQIEAILAQHCERSWELIVVDNNSTDGTAALVERVAQVSDRVRLVRANDRNDKSYAVAAGVAAAHADHLVFCDADDIVAPGWLAAIADGLDRHDVVTGPNQLDALNPPCLAASRGRSGDEAIGTFFGIFPCLRGNNYGMRRSVWGAIGPLSEGFYPVEDLEYSHRCWINGIAIVGLPDAVVYYRYRQEAGALWRQGHKYGEGRVRVARLLRDEGRQTPPRFAGWKSWVTLVLTVPITVTSAGRARWAWIAGNRLGQLVGSVRYRLIVL